MKKNEKNMEPQLSDADAMLLGLIRDQLEESPPPSVNFQRSLREIPFRMPRARKESMMWARAHVAVGALAAVIALLLFTSSRQGVYSAPDTSPFEQLTGQWSYELLAPQEFEPLDPVYHSEFSLPAGYDALEYWVY